MKAAFLSGAEFNRKVIAKLPADCSHLLGVVGPCFMRLEKSAYGLSDAPLLWFNEATRRLKTMKLIAHKLDSCFFYWRDSRGELALLLLLHVDDMLISHNPRSKEACAKVEEIYGKFNFGKWRHLEKDSKISYCGGVLSYRDGVLTLSYEEYIKKIMPIAVEKKRSVTEELTAKEVTKCRGLIGALQWPGTQGAPHLCSSTSIVAGDLAAKDGKVISDLNKTLRFAKENSDIQLRFPKVVKSWKDLVFVAFSDAALGVRRDLGSQGGFLVIATTPGIHNGELVKYSMIAWRSYKLPRVCRSSLAAEAQACATAVDELMVIKVMFNMLLDDTLDIKNANVAKKKKSAVVIDARALYDAAKKPTIQSGLDKRVSIEVMVIRDGLNYTLSELRWVSSERQMADGLTKIGGRQQMCELLKGGYVKLVYDENFTASKKKTKEERQEFNRVARGSDIAMFVATLVANEMMTAEAKETEEHDADYLLYTAILGFVIMVIMAYKIVEKLTKYVKRFYTYYVLKNVFKVDTGIQVMEEPYVDPYMLALEKIKREQDDEIYQLRQDLNIALENAHIKQQLLEARVDENMRLREELAELERRRPVLLREHDVWLTRYGAVWHSCDTCEHLKDHLVQRFRACRTCFRNEGGA